MLAILIPGIVAHADALLDGSQIHIVPLESPPLRVPTPVYGAWFGLVGIALDASRATEEAAAASQVASETLSQVENWQPTVELANYAKEILAERSELVPSVAAQTASIPGMSGRDYTFSGENWLKPIRKWHREKVSTVEYVDNGLLDSAHVLEIALSNFELTGSRFLLAVNVKIVDPTSREVVDSTREWKQFPSLSFDELFENDAAAFRELFEASGRKLIEEALVDLELI